MTLGSYTLHVEGSVASSMAIGDDLRLDLWVHQAEPGVAPPLVTAHSAR